MKNILLLLLLLIIALIACKPSKAELTTDREKLMAVVIDLYYAEAAIKDLSLPLKDSLSKVYRTQIGEIHSVDIDQIEADLETFQKDYSAYQKFHKEVEDSVASKLKILEKEKVKESDKKSKNSKSKPKNRKQKLDKSKKQK